MPLDSNPVQPESAIRQGYRADIDGLRAIAILAVILYHIGLPYFRGGFVGVDIFFVISGYLIGGIVHREIAARQFSFAAFYVRRAKRILPALLVMILIVVTLTAALFPSMVRSLAPSQASALVGVSNLHFWFLTHYSDMDWHADPLVMTWSLGVEEQFYLLLPPLMLLLHRFLPGSMLFTVALLSAGSLGISVLLTALMPTAAFYLLPGRAWELGAGVLSALWKERHPARFGAITAHGLGFAGVVAIALAIAAFDDDTPFPGIAAALPVLGTVALILAEGGLVGTTVLASPPARLIGMLSYSWYLWHWPFIAFARFSAGGEPASPILIGIAASSFVIAFLSWRFVETPFRKPSRLSNRMLLLRYAAAILVCLAVVGGVALMLR
ncbi:acyltransferase family protein [Sphingomonas oryzagri]